MTFTGRLRKTISKFDFFHTIQLLRYKQENQYQSCFGGCASLLIILALCFMFYGKLLDTINKNTIITKQQTANDQDPPPYTISTLPGSKFMIGLEVWLYDINTGPRYFDIQLINQQINFGTYGPRTQIMLEPCTAEHWAGFTQVQQKIKKLNIAYWKCLPLNRTYNIQGRYSSDFSQIMDFSIKKCTNKSSQSRSCASQADIDQYFADNAPFYFVFYFTNPIINPQSQEFLKYYLEDNNFIMFTQTFGSQMYFYMQDYTIITDQSINPFSDTHQQKGGIISDFAVKNPYQVTNATDFYCLATIYKASTSWTYERSFIKLDQLLSYVGGLFGIIILAFFVINIYNSHSFQINIADSLFEKKQLQSKDSLKKYNFIYFLIQKFYECIKMIGIKPNWKKARNFQECRNQMLKQLDISYLVKRVTFLETIIENVIQPHQLKGIQLHQDPTLAKAKRKRLNFKLKKRISKISQQYYLDQNSSTQFAKTESIHEFYQVYSSSGMKTPYLNSNNSQNNQSPKMIQDLKLFSDSIKQIPQEIIDDSSSSSDEQFEEQQDFLEQISQLYQEAMQNDPVSKRIWDKISQPVKQKIIKIIKLNTKKPRKRSLRARTKKRTSLLPLPKRNNQQMKYNTPVHLQNTSQISKIEIQLPRQDK